MTERSADWLAGYQAGVQAAWEVTNAMVQTISPQPITHGAKVMRDTALDIGDNILDLKKRADGSFVSSEQETKP